ncbi:hypothetical protein CASFOL_006828 [Castilleja foliolosa]|uniref:Uncharacterized protein n=1 Tax=Castilleja foliolosa TaxID=1961234 RepID=A0ABD3EBE1_9LAMI
MHNAVRSRVAFSLHLSLTRLMHLLIWKAFIGFGNWSLFIAYQVEVYLHPFSANAWQPNNCPQCALWDNGVELGAIGHVTCLLQVLKGHRLANSGLHGIDGNELLKLVRGIQECMKMILLMHSLVVGMFAIVQPAFSLMLAIKVCGTLGIEKWKVVVGCFEPDAQKEAARNHTDPYGSSSSPSIGTLNESSSGPKKAHEI